MTNTTILCRVGKKTKIKNYVIKLFPNNFDLYIEPFLGSGAIFLNAKLENKKSILNDLDKSIIFGHNSIKSGVTLDEKTFTFSNDPKVQEQFYKKKHSTTNDNFISSIIQGCGTFGGTGEGKIYRPITQANFRNKIKNAKKQKEYYKNTRLFNIDYKKIIKKFDNKNSFFYLDPPYEKSDKLYKDGFVDLQEMSNILKTLKGKFLLSINDSPNVRKIFKDFNIKSISVEGYSNENSALGAGIRKELLIKNY
tara:strand:+ start:40 stop:792 length:753 start_codon:yes stop_codon:yes gene_type:complete